MRALTTYQSRSHSRLAGFTLLELLIVLTLIGLIMSVVLPSIVRVLPGVQLHRSATGLAAVLRSARSKAVSSARTVTVEFDPELGEYGIGGGKQRYQYGGELRWLDADFAELQLNADEQRHVQFFPHGGSSGAQLALENNGRQYQINVNWLTGAVQIDE
jgi:general secretion pathway protein H